MGLNAGWTARKIGTGIIAAVVICAAVSVFLMHHHTRPPLQQQTFASLTANIEDFQPYAFKVLDGFSVENSTIAYSQGVLIFALRNGSGQSLAVTEQLLPESVAANADPKATPVNGVDGTAIITYHGTTTTGALFSSAHHSRQTMVLISTTDPISQDTLQDLLRGLRPTSS